MKSVLLSIQSKWCEKIASGEKTVEVRKTKPEIFSPFKCYIYCTISGTTAKERDRNIYTDLRGKVIGEFICNFIDEYNFEMLFDESMGCYLNEYEYNIADFELERACLSYKDFKNYGKEKSLFGWYISDLVIYDKPKELSEFKKYNRTCYYDHLGYATPKCKECKECNLKRPPQSWCYVQDLER